VVEKFDYYDAIAHLIPGTVGCLFLLYTLDLFGIAPPKPDVGSLGTVGIGIAVAYTMGHLLQSLASSLEPLYYAVWGGKPSVRLLERKSRQFSDQQRQQLIGELIRYFGVKENCPEDRTSAQNFYQRLFERCMALCNRNKLGRVDAFNAIYGFHRGALNDVSPWIRHLRSHLDSAALWGSRYSGCENPPVDIIGAFDWYRGRD